MLQKDHVRLRLDSLRLQHRDLDTTITALARNPAFDPLQLRSLKKRRLQLKETITRLESSSSSAN